MEDEGDSRWWLVIGLVPAALVVLPRLPALAWADQLPDPMAVNFSLTGSPQSAMSLWASEAISGGLALMIWLAGAVMVRRAPAWRVRRAVAAFTVAMLGFLALLGIAVLLANMDAATWQQAQMPAWTLVLTMLGAAALGYLAWLLCGHPPAVDAPRGGLPLTVEPPTANAAPGTVWEGTSSNGWLLTIFAGIGGTLLVLAPQLSWWLLPTGVFVALLGLGTGTLHVRCDANGLTVRYGLLGWPVQRIPMAEIRAAYAVDLDPAEWGGWGYRWAPRQNGTAAVTRRGPAIVVQRKDGRRFAVTVDDAATGAGVLNDLRAFG